MHNKGVPEPQWALDRVKIIENGDPLADLRDIPGLTFRSVPGKQVIPFLRAPVADMVRRANEALNPHGFHLHVVSALRDLAYQAKIYQQHYDRYRGLHPDWPEHMVRRAANKYAAPVDHPAPPGHTTGAAVDVVLQKSDGSFVDLVPPDLTDWTLGHTWTDKIDPETYRLRMLLVETMLGVGFSNCRDEYWHYSWGDSGWAVRVGKKECCYGAVAVPEGWV